MKTLLDFNDNGEYDFQSIPESACRIICEVHDAGERYAPDSRYTFCFNGYEKNQDGFRFGSAKACIQSYLIENNKKDQRFDIINETPNGSQLKMKSVRQVK